MCSSDLTLGLVPLDASRASVARAVQVAALLAPAGITTVTIDAADPGPVPVIIVCGSPDADADEARAAVDRARARGASTVVLAAGDAETPAPGAAERITDDMDVLTFSDRMLDALGVPR